MDEGTTSRNHNLHFVIEAPLTQMKPYPFKVVPMEGGDTDCYIKSIPKGLLPLNILHIKIGSVVIDGNTAQKKAWNHDYNKSVLHDPNIPNAKDIIVVPCLCHRIHNSYKRIALSKKGLRDLVAILHSISKTSIEKRSEIGAICPEHMNTRWANDYDVVKFILDHKEKILKIDENLPINQFEELEKVLRVYKCLISKFENPKTHFSTAFLTLERAINCLAELESKLGVHFGNDLSESLSKYTLEAIDGGIWALAYSFTPHGRADFMNRLLTKSNPKDKSYLQYFNLEDYPQFDNNQSPYNKLDPAEEIFMTENGDAAESNDDTTPMTEEEDDHCEDKSDDENEVSALTEENAKRDQFKHVKAAKIALKKILQHRNRKKDITKQIQAYNSYLEPDTDDYGDYITLSSQYSWVQIRSEEPEMDEIGDIAMRLLSASTSETSCERAIKRQRLTHTNRRMRSKSDLLDARNILQSI